MHRPSHLISIVDVKAGQLMSETFLKKAVTECRSGIGLCVREPGRLVVEKFHDMVDTEKTFELLKRINTSTQKFPRHFYFCSFPVEFDEDEVPPFTVIKDSKGNPILIVACEGDFKVENLANEDGFGESFVLVHEYLGPKLEEMYKVLGNNPGKLFEYLKTDTFSNDLKQVTGHRGVFSFMPSLGEPFILGDPKDLGTEFDWGRASNAFGHTESTTAAATPLAAAEPPPVKKNVSKYDSDDDAPAAPAKPAAPPAPKVDPPKAVPKEPDVIEHVAKTVVESEYIDWTPSANLHGKKLKQAYRSVNNGVLPKDWVNRPTLRIKATRTTKTMEPSQTAVVPLASAAAAKVAAAGKNEPTSKLDVLKVPVITSKQQADGVDFIKKYLGDGSLVMDEHPLEAQKEESKLHRFSELVLKSGDLDEVMNWPTAGIFKFVKDNPELAALAIIEYRRDRKNRQLTATAGDKTLKELTNTEAPLLDAPAVPLKKANASKYD